MEQFHSGGGEMERRKAKESWAVIIGGGGLGWEK